MDFDRFVRMEYLILDARNAIKAGNVDEALELLNSLYISDDETNEGYNV